MAIIITFLCVGMVYVFISGLMIGETKAADLVYGDENGIDRTGVGVALIGGVILLIAVYIINQKINIASKTSSNTTHLVKK